LDVLLEQCRAAGSTLVIVTHNPDIAKRTDRCVRLVEGRLEEGAAA
jgi:predicted ABC-type transport system involved in lysophospholipase L1 biosynthesis ATPase subunit